jgi:hypothetical protein
VARRLGFWQLLLTEIQETFLLYFQRPLLWWLRLWLPPDFQQPFSAALWWQWPLVRVLLVSRLVLLGVGWAARLWRYQSLRHWYNWRRRNQRELHHHNAE